MSWAQVDAKMNSGNQIRNKMIQSHPKTDRAKLAGLETFLHEKFPMGEVELEPYMMFTKGEDEYIGWAHTLTRDQVSKYKIHPPDALLFLNTGMTILELDGPIHDIKTWKTSERNRIFELNNLTYRVVNERDLKDKLGIAKSAPLSQDQINEAFFEALVH